MKNITTRIFIFASIAFGIIGMLLVLTTTPQSEGPNPTLVRLLFATVFIILPSFALSVASAYLNGKD